MYLGKNEDLLKDKSILAEILRSKGEKRKKTNPLLIALSVIGAMTVVFALVYSVYNLVLGNAYKDDDNDEEEFEEEETENQ